MKILSPNLTIPYNAGAAKILTSDASGNGTWQLPDVTDVMAFAFFMSS